MALMPFGLSSRARAQLEKLEHFGREWDKSHPHDQGVHQLKPESAEFLWTIAYAASPTHALEVGCGTGYSSVWLASSLARSRGQLLSVDINEDRIKIARERVALAGFADTVTFLAGRITSSILEATFPAGLDLVFIDCHKSDYVETVGLLLAFMKLGSFLLADNLLSHRDELAGFVKEIESLQSKGILDAVLLPCGQGLLAARVINVAVPTTPSSHGAQTL